MTNDKSMPQWINDSMTKAPWPPTFRLFYIHSFEFDSSFVIRHSSFPAKLYL